MTANLNTEKYHTIIPREVCGINFFQQHGVYQAHKEPDLPFARPDLGFRYRDKERHACAPQRVTFKHVWIQFAVLFLLSFLAPNHSGAGAPTTTHVFLAHQHHPFLTHTSRLLCPVKTHRTSPANAAAATCRLAAPRLWARLNEPRDGG